jgi:hypothetical protein
VDASCVQLSAGVGNVAVLNVDADGGADAFVPLAMLQNVMYSPRLLEGFAAAGNLMVG